LPGPRFASDEFAAFLLECVEARKIDIVIPNIDPATVALAKLRERLEKLGVHGVVSSVELCQTMHDKVQAEAFFRASGLPIPFGQSYPLLAKPRWGSASRGHVIFADDAERAFWAARNDASKFILQPFIKGNEYSIDAYVDRRGKLTGHVARLRVVVSGGEVNVTQTEQNAKVLEVAERALRLPGWYGPMNVQVIDAAGGPLLVEVNPRFGSGVTCSIEAGLDVPRYILRERLGLAPTAGPVQWKSGLCMTRSRKDHFLWLS
jgi:carbamoyl-phosphate synthase large subunit